MVKKAVRVAKRARIAAEKWRQYWQYNINNYHQMHEFVLGKQWEDEEQNMLKTYKKVPLTFNKLGTLANNLLGEQQQNTPQLQVIPMENCDEETAHLRELIVKDLIFSSGAKVAYQVAASQDAIGGFGAFLWDTAYAHKKSFDVDIVARYFKDATLCYWDVGAEHRNKIDGMVCGYLSRMTRLKFREVFGRDLEEKITHIDGISAPAEEVALATDTNGQGEPFSWVDDDGITIQHHYERKFKKDTLYKLSNGSIYNQEEMDNLVEKSREHVLQLEMMMGLGAGIDEGEGDVSGAAQEIVSASEDVMTLYDRGEPVRIVDSRSIKKSIIHYYKLAGDYILEDTVFPAENLPLIFLSSKSYYDKNGKQITKSFFEDAKDAQRYLNYLGTQSAYMLKVSRYDQWIGSKKNVSSNDTAQVWRDPLSVQGMLTFDESPGGVVPQQTRPPELSQSLLTQYERAMNDLYTSTGLYPTRLGEQGNEVSGAAIDARTRQGSYATFTFFNAINMAITAGGQIVNEMIPVVYDAERTISLMTPDEGQKTLVINRQADEYGEIIENDIRQGTYEVRLIAGPSYEGQKAQALESLNMVLQANPQLLNLFADLYAENLPLPNTIEIKNRLKTIVPPQIIEAGKTGKLPQDQSNQPSPEQQAMIMQQQMAQMEMQAKAQELELKQQELVLKAQKQQAETEREMARLETERLEVAAQLEEQKLRYLAETHRTNSDAAIAHADNITKILTHKIQ